MTKRTLLTAMIGYCMALLLLGLIGGMLTPSAAMADGTGNSPPPDSTPESASEAPYADSAGSMALVDLFLDVWTMTL